MSNIHRLPPAPKIKRHGVIRCEISEDITMRELRAMQIALEPLGISILGRGVIRIEHAKRGAHG